MLPLLKENIEKTELAYFIDHLLPLARKLKAKAEFFAKNKKLIESKIFENLQNQVCLYNSLYFNLKNYFVNIKIK